MAIVVGRGRETGAVAPQLLVNVEPQIDDARAMRPPRGARVALEQIAAVIEIAAQNLAALGPKRAQPIRLHVTTASSRLMKTAADPKSLA